MDVVLNQLEADITIVDFHAETTSEKQALGWYLNNRVTVMFGTHTHVQTSDARLLSKIPPILRMLACVALMTL